MRSSVGWTAVSIFFGQVIGFARTVIVARLLTPDDFGLFGMAMSVLTALIAATNLSLENSVIANRVSDDGSGKANQTVYLDTVWTIELGRRCLISGLIAILAVPLANFYRDDRLITVLHIVCLVPLAHGLRNVNLVLLRKDVKFKAVAWFEQLTNLATTVITIWLAYRTRSVWALIYGQLGGAIMGAIISYSIQPHRPRFALDRDALKTAFRYGKYMFVVVLMTYITTTADNVFVGRFYGASVLGTYIVAYTFANIPVGVIYGVLSSVMFPAYAELKEKGHAQLENAFVRVFAVSAVLLVAVMSPAVALATDIVAVVYGEKWSGAASLLQILSLLCLCRGLVHIVSPLLLGINQPAQEAKAKVIEAIVFLAVLYPLTLTFGAKGAAWAGVLTYAVALAVRFALIKKIFPHSLAKVLRIAASAFAAGAVGCLISILAIAHVNGSWLRIVAGGAIAVLTVMSLSLLMIPLLRKEAIKAYALFQV